MKRPLMGLSIALIAGIIVGWFDISWYLGMIVFILFIFILKYWTDSSYKYLLGLSVLFVVGFCRTITGSEVTPRLEETICGRIYNIEEKEKVYYLFVKEEQGDSVLVVVKKEDTQAFYKGQRYVFKGDAEAFEEAGNPGQFDETGYYRSKGVSYRLWAQYFVLKDEGNGFLYRLRFLEYLKHTLCDFYEVYLSPEGNGIIQAAVLGERKSLDKDLKQYYQENGWMHLITTSGLHLSFVAMNVYKRLRKMTVRQDVSTIAALLLMCAYGYMTNFGDSMYRAMGMMTLALMAKIFGRRTDGWTSLGLLAAILLLLRPERLESVGFILTFTAVAGMEFGKWIYKMNIGGFVRFKIKEETKWEKKLKENICVQMGIFVLTLPVVLTFLYEVPVYGFFYNFFMIPLMGMIVPVAFAAGVCGIEGIPVLKNCSIVVLKVVDGILKMIHRLPARVWRCGCPKSWQLILFIIGICITVFLILRKEVRLGWVFLAISCCFIMFFRVRTDQVVFMDVGQGDGMCVMTQDGHVFLIDGGSSDVQNVFKYRIEPMLKYYGVKRIEGWFLSHGDQDHISGVKEALDSTLVIQRIFVPERVGDEMLDKICREAEKRGIWIDFMTQGKHVRTESVEIQCLYPGDEEFAGDKNNHSMVLAVIYANKEKTSILMTGDIEAEGERDLLESKLLKGVDILKVAHHGSKGSTSEKFLEKICPAWAIISCGENNSYGHPHKEVLERLKKVNVKYASTANQGALILHIEDEKYTLYAYKNQKIRHENQD